MMKTAKALRELQKLLYWKRLEDNMKFKLRELEKAFLRESAQ